MFDIFETAYSALHSMRELGGPVVNWIFIGCVLMWAIVL